MKIYCTSTLWNILRLLSIFGSSSTSSGRVPRWKADITFSQQRQSISPGSTGMARTTRSPMRVTTGGFPLAGIHYQSLLPVADLSALPDTFRTLIYNSQVDFVRRDRGHIRRGNDKSLDSRAQAFQRWCDSHSIRIGTLHTLAPEGIILVLG
jgi:hypothetical protein